MTSQMGAPKSLINVIHSEVWKQSSVQEFDINPLPLTAPSPAGVISMHGAFTALFKIAFDPDCQ